MSNDTELLKLCKEVYERTGWGEPSLPCWIDNATEKHAQQGYPKVTKYIGIRGKWEYGKQYGLYIMYPLYTSDYLLEKLPKKYNNGILLLAITNSTQWGAEYYSFYPPERGAKTDVYISDTPLKALLKLTIALSEAGVKL